MKIEEGKYYKLENGDRVFTKRGEYSNEYWPFIAYYPESGTGKLFIDVNGSTQSGLGDYSTPNIVEEWKEPEEMPTDKMSGRVIVDITDQLDDIMREELEWHALEMLKEGNDEFETIGNKAQLFASFCKVIKYYSTKEQWEEFVAKTKGKKVE